MKPSVFLVGHFLASLSFTICAERLGRLLTARHAITVVNTFVIVELAGAAAIVLLTPPLHRKLMGVGAIIAALWGLLCAFTAGMAATGNWM